MPKSKFPTIPPNALRPSGSLLSKVGSIVVHADELMSADGHPFDDRVLRTLLADPEVVAWVKSMGAMVPVKRKPAP